MIRHNLFWKLFALVVAMSLWAYVNAERNPQSHRAFTVPIAVKNLAKGYVADFVDSRDATVSIQGPSRIVDGLRKEDVDAWVELKTLQPGQERVEQSAAVQVRVAGVSESDLTASVTPKKTAVRVEALRSKSLPVEVKFLVPPPLGFSYSEPEITPATVELSGKASAVSRVRKAVVALSEQPREGVVDEDFKVLPVDVKGNVVSGVDVEAANVHLRLRYVEALATKTVIVSPKVVGQPKFPARVTKVEVTPATVTVQGKPSVLVDLNTISTQSVSIDGAEETVIKEASLRVPSTVQIVGRSKVRVTVRISAP